MAKKYILYTFTIDFSISVFMDKIIGDLSLFFIDSLFDRIMQPFDTCVEQIAYIQVLLANLLHVGVKWLHLLGWSLLETTKS